MLIEQDWKPGVWIDGRHSPLTDIIDAFGAFAHHVHEDLLGIQAAGGIPAYVEITLSASTLTSLWEDDNGPTVLIMHIRFTGLGQPEHRDARKNVCTATLYSIDRRIGRLLTPEQLRRYTGALFFVDDNNRPQHVQLHHLSHHIHNEQEIPQ